MVIPLTILAGALGAGLRFLVSGAIQRSLTTRWPWGTAVVNAAGALLLGFVVGVEPGATTAMILAGGLGGFTTFSTWMVEAAALWVGGPGGHLRAAVDVLAPLVVGIALAAIGMEAGRAL